MDATFWQAVELDRPGSGLFNQFKQAYQALVLRLEQEWACYQSGQQIDRLGENLLNDIGVSRIELRFIDTGIFNDRV